ncbi:cupin domain-containing protein [Streptomyces sp. NPDC048643]|uniref:cupin domain-containing protein n=1 Tax=Streptomyces sp. NPDC048643 TaxID=3155637 RepID=UPI003444A460
MYTPTFEDLVGDERQFFSEYFNRQLMYRPRSLPVDPRKILSIAELDELLHLQAIRRPYLRLAKDGVLVLPESYTHTERIQGEMLTDAITPSNVYEHFRAGASITWPTMNHYRPNLRELCSQLGTRFATRSDAVAFLTPAGQQGFNPHYDPGDLFIIQLEGRKHWKLWAPPEIRKGDSRQYKMAELGEPSFEIDLEPGDVLYLPYNTPHVAPALDSVSLHLTIQVAPRRWSDLLASVVQHLAANDSDFWSYPYMHESSMGSLTGDLKRNIEMLTEKLAGVDGERELQRLIGIGREDGGTAPAGGVLQELSSIDQIEADTALTRKASINIHFGETENGKTLVSVSGMTLRSESARTAAKTTLKLPEVIASTLQRMDADTLVRAGDVYPGTDTHRSVEAAKTLARLGILTPKP